MSNQPEQPQPYPGQPANYTPPGYIAPPVPPQYETPPAPDNYYGGQQQFQNAPAPQYGQPQFQNPPGSQYSAPTYYQGGSGYVGVNSGPRGFSLTSMILGLTSLILVGFMIVPQIVGIVLGHIGLRKESPQGRAFSITGLITNYLALLIWGVIYAFYIFFFAMIMSDVGTDYSSY